MSEETQTVETQTPEKEVTLDDVYRDAGLDKVVEAQPEPQQQQQQQQVKPEPSSIPDPYDAENFKAYMTREAAEKNALKEATVKIAQFLTAEQQKRVMESTKADIDSAVGKIKEVVGDLKPKVIEAALDGMVREDPKLKAIWNNRNKNPAAWDKAVQVVSKQIADDFSVKVDPALVAAQRARKDSQRQMATTSADKQDSSWEGLNQAEFDLKWQQTVSGGN